MATHTLQQLDDSQQDLDAVKNKLREYEDYSFALAPYIKNLNKAISEMNAAVDAQAHMIEETL